MLVENIGFAGQFVAALMQTIGMYTMSEVLDSFDMLLQKLALLLFIWGIAGAILNFVLLGNTRYAVYFLIGPALFYWMTMTRIPANYTQIKFGDRTMPNAGQQISEAMQETIGTNAGSLQPRVPFFYAKFDNLVSGVVQTIVSFLVDTKNKEDIIAGARERIMSRVLAVKTRHQEFQKLLAASLMGNCGEQIMLQQEISRERLANSKAGSPEFEEFVAKQRRYQSIKEATVPLDGTVRIFLKDNLSIDAPLSPTCVDIWDYTKQVSLKSAEELLKVTDEEKKNYGLTDAEADSVLKLVREKLTAGGTTNQTQAIQVLAAYFLKNSLAATKHGAFSAQLEGREDWAKFKKERIFGNIASHEAAGIRVSLMYIAGTIPYVQAILLFGLTVSFPFFCLLLVIPSHAASFKTWLSLWIWVKSWDIGFAVVVTFREILWRNLPNAGTMRTESNFTTLNWDDPASVMNLVYRDDPTANMHTYYGILNIAVLSIPYISAQFCRSGGELWEAMSARISEAAQRMHRRRSNAGRVSEGSGVNALISRLGQHAAMRGAQEAKANPGQMADGTDRAKTMDGSLPLHMISGAKEGYYDGMNSSEVQALQGYRGALHGRTDTFMHGFAKYGIDSVVNTVQENFRGREVMDVVGGKSSPGSAAWGPHGQNTPDPTKILPGDG